MTPALRSHADNGIWMCQQCGKLIDSDTKYTVDMLHAWRRKSEEATLREVQTGKFIIPAEAAPMLEDMDGNAIELAPKAEASISPARIHAASVADVTKFKMLDAWPKHPVILGLKAADTTGEFHITDLGATIRALGRIAIVSAPGTGKSTTLIQAAESILSDPQEAVAFIRLGNWAKRGHGLIEAVASNPSFYGITARDILDRADDNRLTLILDGWNELDRAARDRAAAEIDDLNLHYPLLRIVISTRRQATELPITCITIDVQALSDDQQMEIARGVAGEDGMKVVDSAWRTEGVRDLVAIPLYLNALVANAPGGVLPSTKEAVLKLFIEGQERKRPHADALRDVLEDNHRAILIGLAAAATPSGNTYLSDANARAIVSAVEKELSNAGQFATAVPGPMEVLDTLVNHDILVRDQDGSVGFQHQQLQEWHASFEVGRAMLEASTGDCEGYAHLVGMLNTTTWEEPILFACERLSRAGDRERDAVAKAIILTLGIDPMLAADIIYRSSDAVWRRVEAEVVAFAERWHQVGKIDRAIRFSIMSGRPEFAELVWPFVETRDTQSYLRVLRHAPRFRPSVLGADRERRLAALPSEVRSDVLGEIAGNSGMDGMELAAKLAKSDTDLKVQLSVVHSLIFRRGIRLASDILRGGSDTLWERVAQSRWGIHLDKDVADRIRQLQVGLTKKATNKPRLLSVLVESNDGAPVLANVELTVYELIVDPTFPVDDGDAMYSVRQAYEQYPAAVRGALLERFKAGAVLAFHGYEMLKGGEPIDAGPIPEMALSIVLHDRQAAIAASLIGEKTASRMLDRLFVLFDAGHRTSGDADSEEKDEYWAIERRLGVVPDAALAHAWLARCSVAEPRHYEFMADLWVTHGGDVDQKGPLALDAGTRRDISRVLRRWARTLIADVSAKRSTMATVTQAIARMGFLDDLDVVEQMLDEELKRKEMQLGYFVAHGRRSDPTNEARMCYANDYRNAFGYLKSEASSKVLEKYLTVSSIAKVAAFAMKDIQDRPISREERRWRSDELDAAKILDRRRIAAEGPSGEECREAAAIFAAVDRLTVEGTTEDQHQIALEIVCAATYMPHNRRPRLVARLLALPVSWKAKYGYMRALAYAGETLNAEHLNAAVSDYYEQAKKHPYLLQNQGAYGLYDWLQLFAFSDHPEHLLEAWDTLPTQLNEQRQLENILRPLGTIGHPHAEKTLFAIAAQNPFLYRSDAWVDAVLQLGTESALVKLLEMADIDRKAFGFRGYAHEQRLQALLEGDPALRATFLNRYRKGEFRRPGGPLEKALAASADADTLIAMVEVKGAQGVTSSDDLCDAVEAVVLEHRPLGDNSYEIHGVNAEELRKVLFAMIDGPSGELARSCLVRIDELRDEHGRVEFEPRHPNIETGRPWPLQVGAD